MASFVDEYEKMEAEKLQRKMAYMAECAKIAGRQKDLIDDAKGQGLNGKVLRSIVKARSFERKAEEVFDTLEDDDANLFKDIREALGDYADLPLGQAAVANDDERTAAVVNAVKADLKPTEQDAWEKAAPAGSA
jgi:uncharacterized protein (UPF0335 family)